MNQDQGQNSTSPNPPSTPQATASSTPAKPAPAAHAAAQAPANKHQLKTHSMSRKSAKNQNKSILIAIFTVLAGIATGFGVYTATSDASSTGPAITTTTPESSSQVAVGETYGANNGEVFSDEAEGVLLKGGVEGEGSHRLLRDGGPSRNVYLTSSILDLSLFEGAKVTVWGETFQAQKAGWLMDVGKVEVLELDATPPFEEDIPAAGE